MYLDNNMAMIERAGYYRKAYTRADGTKVKGSYVPTGMIKDVGLPGKGFKGPGGGHWQVAQGWTVRVRLRGGCEYDRTGTSPGSDAGASGRQGDTSCSLPEVERVDGLHADHCSQVFQDLLRGSQLAG